MSESTHARSGGEARLAKASSANQREFALDTEARDAGRAAVQQTAILGVLVLAFALVSVGFVLAPPAGASPRLGWLVAGIFGGMDVVMVAMGVVFRRGSPVTRVVVTERGLTVRRANAAEEAYGWRDPTFGLTFLDYSDGTPASKPAYVELRLPDRRQGVVNLEVVEAVTSTADAAGVPVLVREELVASGRRMAQVRAIRIGPPERTPGWRSAAVPTN